MLTKLLNTTNKSTIKSYIKPSTNCKKKKKIVQKLKSPKTDCQKLKSAKTAQKSQQAHGPWAIPRPISGAICLESKTDAET